MYEVLVSGTVHFLHLDNLGDVKLNLLTIAYVFL